MPRWWQRRSRGQEVPVQGPMCPTPRGGRRARRSHRQRKKWRASWAGPASWRRASWRRTPPGCHVGFDSEVSWRRPHDRDALALRKVRVEEGCGNVDRRHAQMPRDPQSTIRSITVLGASAQHPGGIGPCRTSCLANRLFLVRFVPMTQKPRRLASAFGRVLPALPNASVLGRGKFAQAAAVDLVGARL